MVRRMSGVTTDGVIFSMCIYWLALVPAVYLRLTSTAHAKFATPRAVGEALGSKIACCVYINWTAIACQWTYRIISLGQTLHHDCNRLDSECDIGCKLLTIEDECYFLYLCCTHLQKFYIPWQTTKKPECDL